MPNKAAPFEVKDADTAKGIVTGLAAVYGNIDDGLDIIEPGAGAKTIAERGKRVKVLWMHDRTKILGVPTELMETEQGLYTVTQFTLDSFWGKEIFSHITNEAPNGARAVDGMSIGYAPVQATVDPDNFIRRISEYKLYEYSFVDLGMNERALVDGAKASSLLDFLTADEFERLIFGQVKAATEAQRGDLRKALSAFSKAMQEPERSNDTPPLDQALADRAAAIRRAKFIAAHPGLAYGRAS